MARGCLCFSDKTAFHIWNIFMLVDWAWKIALSYTDFMPKGMIADKDLKISQSLYVMPACAIFGSILFITYVSSFVLVRHGAAVKANYFALIMVVAAR